MTRFPFLTHSAANDEINLDRGLDFELTQAERSKLAIGKVFLIRDQRARNCLDQLRAEAAQRGNNARLGIDWPDDAA